MARLVNKQFNSPIGLYSPQNIQEVLDREAQILANGAVGIDFRNPDVGKPANLKNSAVLRMLEEEENRQRNGFGPGAKRVAWPPPNESGPDSPYVEQNAVQTQGGPQYPSGLQQNNYHAPAAALVQNRAPLKPLDVRSPGGASPLASPNINQSPQVFRPTTPVKGWAPVHSPVHSPSQPSWKQPSTTQYSSAHQPVSQQTYLGQQYQTAPTQQVDRQQYHYEQQQSYQTSQQYQYKNTQVNQPISQLNQPVSQQQSPQSIQSTQQYLPSTQPQYQSAQPQAPQYTPKQEAASPQVAQRPQPSRSVEPPPSTITLRPQAPVSQAPPPVFNSQPATATLKGGKHLRGDLKWPPENVKMQAEEENRLRLELARGPVFRPKRPNKDYTQFFEQHALNNTYPGYKIPPGTQFYRPA